MRLFIDRVLQEYPRLLKWSAKAGLPMPTVAALREATVFECTETAEWYWSHEYPPADPRTGAFGRLRPGFEVTWWECQFTADNYQPADRWGALVYTIPNPYERPEEDDEPPIVLHMGFFTAIDNLLGPLPVSVFIPLTEMGDWWRWRNGNDRMQFAHPSTFAVTDQWRDVTINMVESTLAAIGFSNARNVPVERHDVPAKVAARRDRKMPAGSRATRQYNVIRLPSATPRNATAGPGLSTRRKPDRVRGHFKTYTADRPLLGRAVGSFYWPERHNDEPDQPMTVYSVGRAERLLTREDPE